MRVSWEYIAGFFDGEGSVSTCNFSLRPGVAATIVTVSQTGAEGFAILTLIRNFLWDREIKGYVHSQARRAPYRQMHHLKICARKSVTTFLWQMLPRVSVKRVIVQDTLRFYTLYPSLRSAVTIERNKLRGKYGALNLDVAGLRADLAAGMSRTQLAQKHGTNTYTIAKYLDSNYRQKYDAYRKAWRARRVAASRAAASAA